MRKKSLLLTPLLLLMPCSMQGQVEADSSSVLTHDDMASFVFSENQLDDDQNVLQSANALTSYNEDPYLSNIGYLFSPMRFRVRGYDSQYSNTYFNGAMMNDLERGRFSYSIVGGLNEVTRRQQGIMPYEQNTIGYMDIGTGSNINLRASQIRSGSRATLSLTNRNYKMRAMFTHATGVKNGWAFAGSASMRYSDEGVIEGTFYHAAALFLGAQRFFNDKHSLSLSAMMAPVKRGAQAASTEEAYWLANSHYYNPNWGYQNGKKRNARVTTDIEPTGVLTWDFNIDENTKLTTTSVLKYSTYGTTALNWNNNAGDPRPDYYKNFPSNAYNVYEMVPLEWQLETWQRQYDYWTASKANRQINWDRMYAINQACNEAGQDAAYLVEERHNNQLVWNLSSTINKTFNKFHHIDAGIYLNHTKGMHYKTVSDLLGANQYTDIDKFSIRDYGLYSQEVQNDLDNPNRIVGEGDKFGYNYNIFVNRILGWGSYTYTRGKFSLMTSADMNGTTIEREGLMRNGRSPEHSKGKSGKAKFLSGGGKMQLGYSVNAQHNFYLGAGYELKAPLANNAFVAPRIKNDFVDNLKNEKILHGEFAYKYAFGPVSGKLSFFYGGFSDQVEQTAFYDDQEQRFTYLTMNGVKKQHYGGEFSLVYTATSNLTFTLLGTLSEAKYTNNPDAILTYENASDVMTKDSEHNLPLLVIADGMRVNGTPLTAFSIGADYNVRGWFFGINLNYYDRVYCDFSEYRRLTKSLTAYSPTVNSEGNYEYGVTRAELKENGGLLLDANGELVSAYSAKQEKFDGGFMLDASIGRFIRLKHGKTISINLSLQNITNNTNLRTGGYEQNRDDKYSTGESRPYVFSKNSKYYYANPFNAFLNIGYKF